MNRRYGFFATGVDDMGRAKALRKGKLFVIKVHGNDGLAPAIRAPTTADRPTPPTPKMATLSFAWTLAVLMTAPAPVITAQPMMAVTSVLIFGSTLTTYR